MSFDLYLFPPDQAAFDKAAFAALFAGRPHYVTAPGEALYRNMHTGVYFSFEHVVPDPDYVGEEEIEEEGEPDPRFDAPYIFFAVHLLRSHVFALEAAVELAALAEAAGLTLYDPQSGRDADLFDPAVFMAEWREANEGAKLAMAGQPGTLRSLPAAANAEIWRWNSGREALRQEVGAGVSVPLLQYISGPGEAVRRVFVWTLDVPSLVPDGAEWALLIDERSSRGLFARLRGKAKGTHVRGIVPIAALAPMLRTEAGCRRLDPATPAQRTALMRQAEPPGQPLAADAVLDA